MLNFVFQSSFGAVVYPESMSELNSQFFSAELNIMANGDKTFTFLFQTSLVWFLFESGQLNLFAYSLNESSVSSGYCNLKINKHSCTV